MQRDYWITKAFRLYVSAVPQYTYSVTSVTPITIRSAVAQLLRFQEATDGERVYNASFT
jgi:hypothetical protein